MQVSWMALASADFREAHLRVWSLFEFGIESNSNWRQMFVNYGLLATVGFGQPLDEDDEKVNELAEQLELPADLIVSEIQYFIRQNCLWTTDDMIEDMDHALKVLAENGCPEAVVDCLLDFSPYAKRPAVLRALRSAVAKRHDSADFRDFLSKYDR